MISFAASCIEYLSILVKLIPPYNIHTTDKKTEVNVPQHAVKIKTRAEICWCVADDKPSSLWCFDYIQSWDPGDPLKY
jgi:hypothetical protein